MGALLCRQKEGPWVYGVASPSTPPEPQVQSKSVCLIYGPARSKLNPTAPAQLALISPTMPSKPTRMDSVDPIRSAIEQMGGWGEPGTSSYDLEY